MTNAERTAAYVAMQRRIGHASKRRKVPRARPPTLIEADYAARLVELISNWRAALQPLIQSLPELAESARRLHFDEAGRNAERLDAGIGRRIRMLLEKVRDRAAASGKAVERTAPRYAEQTSEHSKREVKRQVKAGLGIDIVMMDRRVPAIVEHFAHVNAALIKSLGSKTIDEIEKLVLAGFGGGQRHEDLARQIGERLNVAERHARLIARDQIGSLAARVTAARQQELGLTNFVWRTVNDERVRPEHQALNGRRFSYTDPPPVGLPGTPILCRCSAEPYFGDILSAIE